MLVPLLTYCLLFLAPPQSVNVCLVDVSGVMVISVMEFLMVSMVTFLTMFLDVMMVTGSQGTGPCRFPLSASLG